MKIISDEAWIEKYKPIKNKFEPSNAPYDGTMFETYGAEVRFVLTHPDNKIWTLVDVDGDCLITSGYHHVNRIGYFVTEVEFTEDITVMDADEIE